MKKTLLFTTSLLLLSFISFSQTGKAWSTVKSNDFKVIRSAERESFPTDFRLMELNLGALKSQLNKAPLRSASNKSNVVITLPNANGGVEQFLMYEASNFDADLQAQYPEIRSYVGVGIDDKYAVLRMSLDPSGIQTMVFRADKPTEFMEPYSEDKTVYAVYSSSRRRGKLPFTCSTPEQELAVDLADKASSVSKSSTGSLLTFRLALSCNGEYSNYFGATSSAQSALVLAAFNATMTRVNGVFEQDFAIHMNIVAQTTNVIFYNPATDPYSALANWNTELQQTLNTTLTGPATSLAANNAAYDVGHMFGASGGGGNAGCIGCVCVNGVASGTGSTKGRGITSPADGIPQGDAFDIDYVAHELGHQFGANHTFSHSSEGTGVNKEVGGGVTIMGYAGITSYNTHMNSIDVFHSASIAQVQANMAGKTCPTSTAITHGAPVVNAGANYTIPRSTPFILTGSATDSGGTGTMTFTWEQNDDAGANTGANSVASATKTVGPNFVCYPDTSSPSRYFPTLASIMNGSTTTQGVGVTMEALSSVSRTLNFRLTARDNVAGQGQTNFANMVVTVDGTKGPLTVTSQNTTGISYPTGSTQTVTWAVNSTNTIAGGANVDILITTNNGATWTPLVTNVPNNGSASVTMPATPAPYCRLMVKANGNIFLNVNSTDFAVGYIVTTTCNTYSNNNALVIPDGVGANSPGAVASNSINVPATGTISDVNISLNVSHTWINDLVIQIEHPNNSTFSTVWNRACAGEDNFNITLSDGSPAFACANNMTGTYAPSSPLSVFNGLAANGNWDLYTADYYNADTGQINSWSIEVCTQTAVLANDSFSNIEDLVLYPNPNNGTFSLQFNASSEKVLINVHDIRGRQIMTKSYQASGLFNETINLNNAQSGVYLVTIQDGSRQITRKIVVN